MGYSGGGREDGGRREGGGREEGGRREGCNVRVRSRTVRDNVRACACVGFTLRPLRVGTSAPSLPPFLPLHLSLPLVARQPKKNGLSYRTVLVHALSTHFFISRHPKSQSSLHSSPPLVSSLPVFSPCDTEYPRPHPPQNRPPLPPLLSLQDLFVDTDLYGAHSTGTDALWGGLPVAPPPFPPFPSPRTRGSPPRARRSRPCPPPSPDSARC